MMAIPGFNKLSWSPIFFINIYGIIILVYIRSRFNIYRVHHKQAELDIDFFIYSTDRRGQAVFSGGTYPDIDLGTRFPIRFVVKPLMGKPVAVVPRQVVTAMKRYDSQVRKKGELDFKQLRESVE